MLQGTVRGGTADSYIIHTEGGDAMSGRVGTVYGTAGVDAINPDYVDGSGRSIWMFSDDNLPGNLPDRVIVAAGDATDENLMTDRDTLVEWLAYCQDSLLEVLMD